MSKRLIAIDFDGVIHRYSEGYHDGTCYDVPMTGAFRAIRKLRAKGYEVVVFTARTNEDGEVSEWFEKHWPVEPEYGDIPEITNVKPAAIAFIDDRAIRFTNWQDMLNYF